MEASDTPTTLHYISSSTTSSRAPSSTPLTVLSPCAACKILRRRCVDKCLLAPYFPPSDLRKFATAHRVFGASNIIKALQELSESLRADAVSSMVYEAEARIRDPVYGCAGAIFRLQKQVSELQAQLAKAQAEIVAVQAQHTNLTALPCMEMATNSQQPAVQPLLLETGYPDSPLIFSSADTSFPDNHSSQEWSWEPLWS